jgi:hypothetical protein
MRSSCPEASDQVGKLTEVTPTLSVAVALTCVVPSVGFSVIVTEVTEGFAPSGVTHVPPQHLPLTHSPLIEQL